MSPRALAAVLAVMLLVNGVVLAWRYASMRDREPMSYYEFQVERWEEQLLAAPEDPVIWATLGGLYDQAGDRSKADRAYDRALELDPDNVSALVYKASDAAESGDYDAARSMLTSAINRLPESGRYLVYYELGEVEQSAGEDKAALNAYEASVADNGTYFNAYQRLAYLYAETGDTAKALDAARAAQTFAGGSQQDLAILIEDLESKVPTGTGGSDAE